MASLDTNGCKWARYEKPAPLRASDLGNHRHSTSHRNALAHHFNVDVIVEPSSDILFAGFGRGRPTTFEWLQNVINSKHSVSSGLGTEVEEFTGWCNSQAAPIGTAAKADKTQAHSC